MLALHPPQRAVLLQAFPLNVWRLIPESLDAIKPWSSRRIGCNIVEVPQSVLAKQKGFKHALVSDGAVRNVIQVLLNGLRKPDMRR